MATLEDDIAMKSSDFFYMHGFNNSSVEDLIAHSGVSRRTFYKYYKNKTDVLAAALFKRGKQFLESIDAYTRKACTPTEFVVKLFDYLKVWHKKKGFNGCLFQSAMTQYNTDSQAIKIISSAHKQEFFDFMEKGLTSRGINNAKMIAERINLLIEGALAISTYGNPQEQIDLACSLAVECCLVMKRNT